MFDNLNRRCRFAVRMPSNGKIELHSHHIFSVNTIVTGLDYPTTAM